MEFELTVNTELRAQHFLAEREEPHPHLWKVQVCASGPLENGRVISLPQFKKAVDEVLQPFQRQLLNGHLRLDADTASVPTCENLSKFLYSQLRTIIESLNQPCRPTVEILWVRVAVLESDGLELGSVRYNPKPDQTNF